MIIEINCSWCDVSFILESHLLTAICYYLIKAKVPMKWHKLTSNWCIVKSGIQIYVWSSHYCRRINQSPLHQLKFEYYIIYYVPLLYFFSIKIKLQMAYTLECKFYILYDYFHDAFFASNLNHSRKKSFMSNCQWLFNFSNGLL